MLGSTVPLDLPCPRPAFLPPALPFSHFSTHGGKNAFKTKRTHLPSGDAPGIRYRPGDQLFHCLCHSVSTSGTGKERWVGRAALFLQTAYDGEGGGEAQPGSRVRGPGRAARPPQAGSVALSSPTPPRGSPHTQPRVCPRSQLRFSTSSSLGFRGKTQVTARPRTEMKRCSRDRTDLGEVPPGQGRAEAGHRATTESPRQVSWARCAPCLACPRLGSPTGLLIPFL